MAIYGVGAAYGGTDDVSQDFINNNLAGVGWPITEAPEQHQLIASLQVGDIIYIKAYSPNSPDIIVKAIGFVADGVFLTAALSNNLVEAGRNVTWRVTKEFRIPKVKERNNVRLNSIYADFHPVVQAAILAKL